MARDKKSMIGFDPLAWLDNDNAEKDAVEKVSEDSEKPKKNKTTTKSTNKSKAKMINVLGHTIDETALLKGYELAQEVIDEVVEGFYDELFSQHPEVKPLFSNADEKSQAGKLSAALRLLVDNLHNEDQLKTVLEDMGRRHQQYGALPEHYPVVADMLVASFKKKIGRSWTKPVSAAWLSLLGVAAETMYSVYVDDDHEIDADEMKAIHIDEHDEENININSAASDAQREPVASNVIQLKSVQDISKSQALKNDLILMVNENDEIDIDGSLVERIDGSALQLICALFVYAKENNLSIHWIEPSDALILSAKTLGISQMVELT